MSGEGIETGRRDLVLDGWRGLALIGVLFDHFVTREGLNLGRFGVELFFVLSGRLMADILFVRRAPLVEFLYRRLTRIYPVLVVFATVLYVKSKFAPDMMSMISLGAFGSILTLSANYFDVLVMRTPGYDHIWSLCVEQHAYIVLAIVALLGRKLGLPVLPIIVALALAGIVDGAISTYAFGQHYNQVFWRSDVRGASILVGAAMFLVLREPADRPPVLRGSWVPIVAGAASLLLNINVVPDSVKYSLGTVLLAFCLTTLDQAPARLTAFLSTRILVTIGIVSFSVYVWQEPFAETEDRVERLALLPVALMLGVVSFHLVEQPARRGLNKLWKRRAGSAAG